MNLIVIAGPKYYNVLERLLDRTEMEILKINGKEKQFGQVPSTVSKLLAALDINEATVVAEINGQIVERTKFTATQLRSGQSIELIRFVGGG